jgi:hypothetical protein
MTDASRATAAVEKGWISGGKRDARRTSRTAGRARMGIRLGIAGASATAAGRFRGGILADGEAAPGRLPRSVIGIGAPG